METSEFRRQRVARLPETVTEKWSRTVLEEGFVPFPKRLLRCLPALFDGESSIRELAVALAIVDYRRPRLTRGPSLAFLAFLTAMSEEEFRKHLESLARKNLIKVEGTDAELKVDLQPMLDRIIDLTAS